MKRLTAISIFVFCVALPLLAMAQGSGQPIDISADQALEWDRQNARYIARGNAVAKQGASTVKADTLTANYDPADSGATDLTVLNADGNVEIINEDTRIFGQKGTYDLQTEIARVTGDSLKMQAPTMMVTAQEYFEYDARGGKITAKGNAVATEGDKRLETDKIIAYMNENAQGETTVTRYEAPGRVKIITPTETAVGNSGTYDPVTQKAILTGNVQITQEHNVLNGEKAEVNMATGVSRMFAAQNKDGSQTRVRGTFYPKQGND